MTYTLSHTETVYILNEHKNLIAGCNEILVSRPIYMQVNAVHVNGVSFGETEERMSRHSASVWHSCSVFPCLHIMTMSTGVISGCDPISHNHLIRLRCLHNHTHLIAPAN